MVNKKIYLSPRQILTHLLDIEKKVGRKEFKIYTPSKYNGGPISDGTLENEAKRMFEFAGIYNLEMDVSYGKTAEGTGGNCLNNGIGSLAQIRISDTFRNNWKASIAILAHEVCHKILFLRWLYNPDETENEIYAELTTIYLGFGELVLNGYQADNHCLGYLTLDTYKEIFLLVSVVCGNINSSMLKHLKDSQKEYEPWADEVINLWEGEFDKRELVKKYFVQTEQQIAEYHKNILFVEQILSHLKTDIKNDFEKCNQFYYKDSNSALEMFFSLYVYYISKEDHSEKVTKLNSAVIESLYNMYSIYQETGNMELKLNLICPKCGNKNGNSQKDNKRFIELKCGNPECGLHSTFDTEPWNATVYQRISDLRRKAENDSFNKKVDAHEKNIQGNADIRIYTIRKEAEEKIDDIKKNERQRAKDDFLNSIPSFLRWLVVRYVKKNC